MESVEENLSLKDIKRSSKESTTDGKDSKEDYIDVDEGKQRSAATENDENGGLGKGNKHIRIIIANVFISYQDYMDSQYDIRRLPVDKEHVQAK